MTHLALSHMDSHPVLFLLYQKPSVWLVEYVHVNKQENNQIQSGNSHCTSPWAALHHPVINYFPITALGLNGPTWP